MDDLIKKEREIKNKLLIKEKEFNALYNKDKLDEFKFLDLKEDLKSVDSKIEKEEDDKNSEKLIIENLLRINKNLDHKIDPYQNKNINSFFKNYYHKITESNKKKHKEKISDIIFSRHLEKNNFEESFQNYLKSYNDFLYREYLMDKKRDMIEVELLEIFKKMNFLQKNFNNKNNNYVIYDKEYFKNEYFNDNKNKENLKKKMDLLKNNLKKYEILPYNDITLEVDEYLKNN